MMKPSSDSLNVEISQTMPSTATTRTTTGQSSVSVATTSNGTIQSATGITQAHISSSVSTTVSSSSTDSIPLTPVHLTQTPITPATTTAGRCQSQSLPSSGATHRTESLEPFDQKGTTSVKKTSSVPNHIRNTATSVSQSNSSEVLWSLDCETSVRVVVPFRQPLFKTRSSSMPALGTKKI